MKSTTPGKTIYVSILIALLLSACAAPTVVCTPPPCRADEVYWCQSGDCPGGCGIGCATKTPAAPGYATATPIARVVAPGTPPAAVAQPCVIAATRTPAPSAPTRVPAGPGARAGQVDPHIEICASATTLQVGDTVTVIGEPVDLGLPNYTLALKDDGMTEFAQIVQVTYDNKARNLTGTSQVLEYVSAEGKMNRVVFVLRARAPGTTQVRINATGEIHYGYPGPAMWGGGGSESAAIVVLTSR